MAAKLKKKAEKKTERKIDHLTDEHTLAAISQKIMGSAQQIWQAGLGAFGQAQEQGSKMFDTLVKEGLAWEKATRKYTTSKVDEVREVVESTVSSVKERATDTLDRLEHVFEDRVSRALGKLGIPGRRDLEELSKQVAQLHKAVQELKKLESAAPSKPVSTLKAAVKSVEQAVKAAPAKAKQTVEVAKKSVATAKRVAVKAAESASEAVKDAVKS